MSGATGSIRPMPGCRRAAAWLACPRPSPAPPECAPRVPAALGAILVVMASRVTSTTLRRTDRRSSRSCAARVAEAVGGRPSLAFVAGESGVGKTRLLGRARARGARGRHARDRRRLRRAGRGRAAVRADRRRPAPAGALRRPRVRGSSPTPRAARSPRSSPASARARPDDEATAQARLFDGLLELLELLAGDDGPDGHDRGPALGRPLDARVPRLPRQLAVPRARAGRHHLPPRRAAPPPPAAPAAGRARARRPRTGASSCAPLTRERARRAARPTSSARRPAHDLLSRLFSRSEGNPLFAEELLAAGTDGRGSLPPTLRDALMLRIERLSGDAQETLRVLAAGRRLDHEIARRGVRHRPARAARRAARGGRRAARRRRRGGPLRVPPRAAARGRRRRPAAGRAGRDAPRARARARAPRRRPARATAARTSPPASRTTTSRPATSRRRWPPACAPRRPPRPCTPTARPPRCTRARCSSGTASPTPRSLPAATTSRCCAPRR